MKYLWIAVVVFVLLLVAAALHMAWYWPTLPAVMASHFDPRGNADAFATKTSAFVAQAALTFGIPAMLLLVALVMPWMPAWLCNLPNKDYWLGPSESRRTRKWVTGHMLWMANAALVLFMALNQAIFQANVAGQPRLPNLFVIALALFIAFTAAWCVAVVLRFRRPREDVL